LILRLIYYIISLTVYTL